MAEQKEIKRQPMPTGRQACEIYSRVVGYLRPTSQWNDGKQAEFVERKTYDKQLKEG
jgi:anaerobic ribonucleoside-triphosphate reductase